MDDLTNETLQNIVVFLSLIALVISWVAKLVWSKQFKEAKNEIIKLKEQQIAFLERENKQLKEFSPIKLREYFLSVKEQLEEYNDYLQGKLNKVNIQIEENAQQDDRSEKILEMMVAMDGKTNQFLEEMENYSNELSIIQRAIKDDEYEIPSFIIKASEEELARYRNGQGSTNSSSRKASVDMSAWAARNHPFYKNYKK